MNWGKNTFFVFLIFYSFQSLLAQDKDAIAIVYFPSTHIISNISTDEGTYISAARLRSSKAKGSINLFIYKKEKKFNLASLGFRLNTKLASLFHRNIKTLEVNSLDDLTQKAGKLMDANPDKMIKHLWFDSHGKYKKGKSLFTIGDDTLTIENILDPVFAGKLEKLTAYCDEQSQITIGSCYGAASYNRPANKYLRESPMNGDSLLLAMGKIFSISPVYGSESWVMVKPFLFGSKWGLAGHPPDIKYMDEIYKPVWEKMGSWKMVDPKTKTLTQVHTPYIGSSGDLKFNAADYLSVQKHLDKMNRKVKKLKPGKYKMS